MHAQFANFIKNTDFAKSSLQNNIILHFFYKNICTYQKKAVPLQQIKIKININN